MGNVLVASRNVTTTIVNITGKEEVIEFVNGLARVDKKVRDYLVKRYPDRYFDPNNKENIGVKFENDFDAIRFYIAKLKTVENAPRLCTLLKSEYENLQGDLLSGKYSVKTVEEKMISNAGASNNADADEDDEDLVGGDVIAESGAEEETTKELKKKKKKHKKVREEEEDTDSEE